MKNCTHCIFAAPDAVTRDWAKGYAAGKKRARMEIVCIVVALYFAIGMYGRYFGA